MAVNFELYKVFYYVASCRSFSEAGKRLFISQSAVSQAIKQLEEQLGTTLFIRSSKQVRLTPEGEILFQHVQQGFAAFLAGEKAIAGLHALEQGEIRIGASDTICKHYLLPYFKQFHTLYPQVRLKLHNRPSPVCLDMLQQGLVDLGVVNLPPRLSPKDFKVVKTRPVQDVFVAGAGFEALKDREVPLEELAGYPILMLEKDSITRQFFDAFLDNLGVHLRPEVESSNLDLLVALAKIGLGIALVTREFLPEEARGEEL
ncbi:MAG TPA: LysR family transcriptional regulator, partial [Clostridia bacterium]|nr:LysR family transcriptional regulator [Clostridia bacterium]